MAGPSAGTPRRSVATATAGAPRATGARTRNGPGPTRAAHDTGEAGEEELSTSWRSPPPDCAAQAGSLCQWVWDNTGADVLARNSDAFASAAIHIVLIVVIALVVRFLLYRAINRLTRLSIRDDASTALRPFRPARGWPWAAG